MSIPVYATQVSEPDDTLRYTFGRGQTDGAKCSNIMAKTTLTQNVDTFSFQVPTRKDAAYQYNDIAVHDKVKMWFGYDAINVAADTPLLAGRIYQISGPLATSTGYVRVIKGRGFGEVLQRRLKSYKATLPTWKATAIPTIVTELATDLGLEGDGSKRDATPVDTIDFTVDVDRYETYFSLLEKLSDYWISAGVQCKKDFYVDVVGHLVWKARPIRTTGVESLVVGQNIDSYSVLTDLDSVRNKIHVYGAKERALPTDHDSWTEDVTKPNNQLDHTAGVWTCLGGASTIAIEAVTILVGTKAIKTTGGAAAGLNFTYNSGYEPNANYYPSINAHIYAAAGYNQVFVRLVDSNGYYAEKWFPIKPQQWSFISAACGAKATDTWAHFNGGTPSTFDWSTIDEVQFAIDFVGGADLIVDSFYFNTRPFYDVAEDATSQTAYGVREMLYIDDELRSTSECESRSEALIYQLKDPPIRVDLELKGNANVLRGDQIPLTIPAENITAQSFDVVTTTYTFNAVGFKTFASAISSSSRRTLPPRSRDEILVDQFRTQRSINRGAYRVK